MRIKHRLFWNEDRSKLLREDNAEAHALAFIPGDEIAEDEAIKFGLSKPKDKPEATKVVTPTSKENPNEGA